MKSVFIEIIQVVNIKGDKHKKTQFFTENDDFPFLKNDY